LKINFIFLFLDLFSEKFCADGVPLWLLSPEDYAKFAAPLKQVEFDNATGLPINC
jgi:endoglycosylceramidase